MLMSENQQQLVMKANALINASYRLDLTEQRLILMSTVRARESGQGITLDTPLFVRAEDYAKQFNVSLNTAYESLQTSADSLFNRYFTFEQLSKLGNLEVVKSRWVSRISYIEKEGQISLVFAPDVVGMITDLERTFTRYDLEQVSSLTSTYAVRLYELMIAWRSIGKTPEFELVEFRHRLGVDDHEYKLMTHFKARVLDFAIEQINEKTDIIANYKQHKRGRTITGFSFTFTIKKSMRAPNTIDMLNGESDTEKSASKTSSKRKKITYKEAEAMAHVGESRPDLIKRLSPKYFITNLNKNLDDQRITEDLMTTK